MCLCVHLFVCLSVCLSVLCCLCMATDFVGSVRNLACVLGVSEHLSSLRARAECAQKLVGVTDRAREARDTSHELCREIRNQQPATVTYRV